ncbi:olfactory receptor 12D1-like [Ambystoma mexicanum]|uniref:olfactory receptor 12D1-like n=1 Tax=Ambystoma mexicanum TaxID=8296 RepID=UPI0037E8CBB6
MDQRNETLVAEFLLLGLTNLPHLQPFLFGIILIVYIINMLGNLTIVVIAIIEPRLHTPMYFFLGNLSFLDICFSSVAVPKMLVNFLAQEPTISFAGCIAQLHFFHFLGSTEVLLLTAMSYDRYVAICDPLRYTTIMNCRVYVSLASSSWLMGFLHSMLHTVMTCRLTFCASNEIKHFFCDIKPILRLACTDTHLNELLLSVVAGSLGMASFLMTVLSYISISTFLLRIRSQEGRRRAFSTCAAHLTVVVMLYGTALFTYVRPTTEASLEEDRVAAVLFTVVTPMLNPIIYTLRNEDVKRALVKVKNRCLLPE